MCPLTIGPVAPLFALFSFSVQNFLPRKDTASHTFSPTVTGELAVPSASSKSVSIALQANRVQGMQKTWLLKLKNFALVLVIEHLYQI